MPMELILLSLVLIVPLTCGLMAATPYLMPKRECFAVTVPESAHNDPEIIALKRRYVRQVLVVCVAATAVASVAAFFAGRAIASPTASEGAEMGFVWALVFATMVPVIVSFALMLRARKSVMGIKRARGWSAPRQETAAVVAEPDAPGAISLWWSLLYVPVLLIVAAIGIVGYPSMPDMIPMHADFQGNVNGYSPKSPMVVGFPVFVDLFMIVCFVFSHWSIKRSKRPVQPGSPATSALAYGMFARAQSIFLLATGLLLCAVIGIVLMLSFVGLLSLGEAGGLVMLACVPVVVGSIALALVYGQAGSRLFKRLQAQGVQDGASLESIPFDDDEHWKLGVFYFNADDASLFVPERFGIGWTLNFRLPAAWAFVAGLALLTLVFVGICFRAVS